MAIEPAPRRVPTSAPQPVEQVEPAGPPAAAGLATPPGFLRRELRAMGTTVTVVLPTPEAAAADSVAGLFETWESVLSRFRPGSELSRLNAAAGRPFAASPLLLEVVATAIRAAHASDGIFDPSLEPALRALGYDRTYEDLALDGPAVGRVPPGGSWRSITIDRAAGTIRLPRGCGLDLGGIAKGMAVDAAVAELAGRGVAAAVVEAGGDMAVVGLPPGAGAWPVVVEVRSGLREVAIASGALATSGISRRRWLRGGVEQHHLLDPRDGAPARNELWSVTAAAASCTQAEVAAKVAYVLGREAGMRFLLRVGIPALLVRRDGGEILVGSWREASAVVPAEAPLDPAVTPAGPAPPHPLVGGPA